MVVTRGSIYGRLLLLGLIWGASFMFIKIIVAQVPPVTLVAGRVVLATLVMSPFIFAIRKRVRLAVGTRTLAWLLALAVFNTTLPFVLISWGEIHLSSSLASMLNAANPLFVMILARIVLAEYLDARKITGIVFGFIGIIVLLDLSFSHVLTSSFLAQLAVLGASFSYAVAAIIVRKHMQKMDKMVLAFYNMLLSSVIISPMSLAFDAPWTLSVTPIALLSWAALGIVATFFALVIFFGLLQDAGPTVSSLVTYVVPVFSMGFGVAFLGESITTNMVIGLSLIFLGVYSTESSAYSAYLKKTTLNLSSQKPKR
ncbi:MAG: DMT family transporter [Deltaproteobacteria bacterium]|nr:DMT family transporter [Deltaproteobacteria bacterium]